ncbi:hypothetical protein HK102_008729 [Quaeritorhiza haematococci]|nr:hypothetical protein HK102_008729 [Quaeritorhiza haematococci]
MAPSFTTTRAFMLLSFLATLTLNTPTVSAQHCIQTPPGQFCIFCNDLGQNVKVRMEAPASVGWAAWGVGRSMARADVMIMWQNPDGSITVSHRLSTSRSEPSPADPPTPQLLTNETSLQNNRLVATFIRPKGSYDASAPEFGLQAAEQDFIWAMNTDAKPSGSRPDASIEYHGRSTRGAFKANLLAPSAAYNPGKSTGGSNGGSGTGSGSGSESATSAGGSVEIGSSEYYFQLHGLLMFFAWGYFLPLGVMSARYFKSIGVWWFRIHWLMLSMTVILSLVSYGLVKLAMGGGGESPEPIPKTHRIFGNIIVWSSLGQAILGIVIDRLFNPNRTSVPIWDKAHWWLGRLLGVMTFVNLMLGVKAYGLGDVFLWFVGIHFVAFVGVMVVLQVFVGQQHHQEPQTTYTPMKDSSQAHGAV